MSKEVSLLGFYYIVLLGKSIVFYSTNLKESKLSFFLSDISRNKLWNEYKFLQNYKITSHALNQPVL